MSLLEINETLKGGPGSGDFGHVGRAGKRGGSGGGGGKGRPRKGRRSRETLDKEIEKGKKPKSLKDANLTHVEDFNYTPGISESYVVKTDTGELAIAKPEVIKTQGREVTAFNISQTIGYDAVPETVLRNIDGKPTTIQKWIHEKTAMERIDESTLNIDENDYKKQIIFDMAIGNSDRNFDNFLVDDNGKIISIDNGTMGELFSGDKDIVNNTFSFRKEEFGQLFERSLDFNKSDFDFVLKNKSKIRKEIESMNKAISDNKIDLNNFDIVMDGIKEYVEGL